jgi:hypothetical protein
VFQASLDWAAVLSSVSRIVLLLLPYFISFVADNFGPAYADEGESYPGVQADRSREVYQDLSTTFFVLLAIFFPSVTGIMTGSNMSGAFYCL